MKVHCFFEQSGTFKKEFKKLGFQAYDYDILNDFNETDKIIDLFSEIEKAYLGEKSLFDDIKEEDIVEACAYVNADSFINKLRNGLDEEVNEGGNNFSSGQRQLLSFARTIVHKPQIMILDEATANIDTETEVLIQESLEKIKNIGTMIVVAHRLSTIQHADNIIVLSHGEILEQGNHQQLLKNKGHYYNLYQIQYNKELLRRG